MLVFILSTEKCGLAYKQDGFPFDFDMVVIDELSSFKSASAKRFKSLLK